MRIKTTQATMDPIPHLQAFWEYFSIFSHFSGQSSSLFLVSRALKTVGKKVSDFQVFF